MSQRCAASCHVGGARKQPGGCKACPSCQECVARPPALRRLSDLAPAQPVWLGGPGGGGGNNAAAAPPPPPALPAPQGGAAHPVAPPPPPPQPVTAAAALSAIGAPPEMRPQLPRVSLVRC